MELQQSPSSSSQIKRLGDDVKAYLEDWYEDAGRPSTVSLAEKTSIMHHVKNEIEPTGITLSQLNRWFTHHRRAERSSGRSPMSPRRKRVGMSILFPTLTNTELDHLKILVEENPNPSSALLTVWVDSPLLPNVTLEDAHRFVKYIQAQTQGDHKAEQLLPAPKSGLYQDDITGDGDESNEEDMLDDESYLITSEPTTSPHPNPPIIKPEPFLTPTLHHPPPMSSSPPIQLPRDPRALLQLLRSHLSTDELKQLLQEGSSDATLMSRPLTLSTNPIISDQVSSPESPISSLLHKPSPSANSRLSNHDEVIVSSDSIRNLARTVSVHSQTQIPYPPKNSTLTPCPGFISRKIFTDLSKLSFKATCDRSLPDQFLKQFELCQKKSQELTTALERGYLREFGMLPSEELKALGFPGLSELPSHAAFF